LRVEGGQEEAGGVWKRAFARELPRRCADTNAKRAEKVPMTNLAGIRGDGFRGEKKNKQSPAPWGKARSIKPEGTRREGCPQC